MGTDKKDKFGLWSIVLLGINGIIGTGIFLLPNRAYALMGPSSLLILLFDAFLAGCLALCFAAPVSFPGMEDRTFMPRPLLGILSVMKWAC